MLLPSAFSCDSSHAAAASSARLQAALFASPPASPPAHGALGFGNILSTCRSLQSLLAAPPALAHQPSRLNSSSNGLMIFTPPAPSCEASYSHDESGAHGRDPSQLPTPPLAHAPCPLKLRLRSRNKTTAPPASAPSDHLPATKTRKISKRAPPRGANKRRRATADPDSDSDAELRRASNIKTNTSTTQSASPTVSASTPSLETTTTAAPGDSESTARLMHTPKRARIAPAAVPMGLGRSDFHALHEPAQQAGGTDVEVGTDGEPWSAEDDRILVELVLEKLRLSREDWEDCARSLGKDRACLGRRWKSLMLNGDVGLRPTRTRRTRLHGTWR